VQLTVAPGKASGTLFFDGWIAWAEKTYGDALLLGVELQQRAGRVPRE
jgi:hypothetical protein